MPSMSTEMKTPSRSVIHHHRGCQGAHILGSAAEGKRLAPQHVPRRKKRKWGPSSGGLGTGTPRPSIGKPTVKCQPFSSGSHPKSRRVSIAGQAAQTVGDLLRIEHERVF